MTILKEAKLLASSRISNTKLFRILTSIPLMTRITSRESVRKMTLSSWKSFALAKAMRITQASWKHMCLPWEHTCMENGTSKENNIAKTTFTIFNRERSIWTYDKSVIASFLFFFFLIGVIASFPYAIWVLLANRDFQNPLNMNINFAYYLNLVEYIFDRNHFFYKNKIFSSISNSSPSSNHPWFTFSKILIDWFDGGIMFLHHSTKMLFEILRDITQKGDANHVALAWLQWKMTCLIVSSWFSLIEHNLLILFILEFQITFTAKTLLIYFHPNVRTYGRRLIFE